MRVGVFGNQDSWYVSEICRVGTNRGHQLFPLLFPEIVASVRHGQVQLTSGSIDLQTLDAVLVRTMPPGTLEQVVARMDILAGLEASGVRIINSPRSLECAVDKYLTTQKLAQAGLPVPATVLCESAEAGLAAFDHLGRDVVIKPLFGAEGRGILRVSDPDLALRACRTLERLGASLYLQEFVNGPGYDIRILLLDGQLVGAMKRTPQPGDFRANIARQGTGSPYDPSPDELRLGIQAAQVTGAVFAGIDLMYDADDRPLLIEVNAVPGWKGLQRVCGIDVPEQLFRWLELTHHCEDRQRRNSK